MSKKKKRRRIVLGCLLALLLLAVALLLRPARIDASDRVSFSADQDSVTAQEANFVLSNHTDQVMQWGEDYFIEKKGLLGWRKVVPISVHHTAGYLWGRFEPGSTDFCIYWGDYYGDLSRGTYRMVKEIWLEKKYDTSGVREEFYVAAEFRVS